MVSKQKILIVDDDNNIAELISLYLTKECFNTMIVNDGEEALNAFASFSPNLILLDLMVIRYAEKSVKNPMYRLSCFLQKVKFLIKYLGSSLGQMTI